MMPLLKIDSFSGEIPRLQPHQLPVGAASTAINCDFTDGRLASILGLGAEYAAHASALPVRSIFSDDGLRFFAWNTPTRATLAPTIDDTVGRVYFNSHGQGIRVAQTVGMRLAGLNPGPPTSHWKVGVTAPAEEITFVKGGSAGEILETVAYCAVAQNIWGEESARSPIIYVEVYDGETVDLSISFTANADEVPIQGINFYRTYASEGNTGFLLINSIPVTGVGGIYTLTDQNVGVVTTTALQSDYWDPSPATGTNLCNAGNGALACAEGKDLVFTEPYRCHAWAYRMTFPHGIMGVFEMDGGLLVTTQKQAYLVSGSHPSQMSQRKAAINQAGWSDTAAADIDGTIVYASNDGLVSIVGGQPSMDSSRALYRRKQWVSAYGKERYNLRMIHHDGMLLGIFDPLYPVASSKNDFLINLDADPRYYTRVDAGVQLYGGNVVQTADRLYVCTATGFREFAEEGSGPLSKTWESGEFRYPEPARFAAGEIWCDDGSVTVEIKRGGTVIKTVSASAGDEATVFKLPDHNPSKLWSVRVTGTGSVSSIAIGPSFEDLSAA